MERLVRSLNKKDNLVTIGRVIKSWGNKGEILVQPITYDPDRFFLLEEVCFSNGEKAQWRQIRNIRRHGKNLIISISDCTNLDDADSFKHQYIRIDKSESPQLPEGQYYYYELEGMNVYTIDNDFLGKIESIMQAGEADVYIVKDDDGKETLIPAIRDFIVSIDVDNKKMVVKPLEMI
ncbi:MAG: ribosome maturation factor RimM [Thermodesulfovibrionales bacterium]